ncbi:hypothetical protein FBULB1_5666 [Fusarium bulbicola]|nr:hypothetical protein FBULB1_5666 [Fusarium bulbicola]
MTNKPTLKLSDASISDLKQLLDTRAITSVELVALYLHRIGKYDCRGPCLNSITLINPDVFTEAQASDDHRASGKPPRPLEGIPFTVKDSYKVKGMTVAAASPAFVKLEATSDAAIVELLRKAGAVVLGKTNMPPMADGGCQRELVTCPDQLPLQSAWKSLPMVSQHPPLVGPETIGYGRLASLGPSETTSTRL